MLVLQLKAWEGAEGMEPKAGLAVGPKALPLIAQGTLELVCMKKEWCLSPRAQKVLHGVSLSVRELVNHLYHRLRSHSSDVQYQENYVD